MPASDPLVSRYADALLALGEASGKLGDVERELPAILDWIRDSESLRSFLADPAVETKGKGAALEELLDGKVCGVLKHWVLAVAGEGCIARLPELVAAFLDRAHTDRSLLLGEVVSAHALPQDKVSEIEREVARIIGRPVRLQPRVNANVIGGVRVQAGHFVLDGTVARELDKARSQLLQ